MSILAGCFSKNGKIEADEIIGKVKNFPIITGDDIYSYNNTISKVKYGLIVDKYKSDYPIQIKPCQDGEGNHLSILGYLKSPNLTNRIDSVITMFNHNISDAPNKLEGEFVLVYCEGRTGKIHIINDRFGSKPFYILNKENAVYFSSNLIFLLNLSNSNHTMDILGCLQLFAYGRTIDHRTTIKDVQRLRAGTHLIISRESLIEKRYWRLKHYTEKDLNPESYSTQVYKTFKKGALYRSKLSEKGIVALSGGLDSRLVAGAITPEISYDMFTFIDSTDMMQTIEVKAATEIGKLLNRKHHIEMFPRGLLSENAHDIVRLTGGLTPLHHPAKVMGMINSISKKGFNYLMGGAPGDVMSGDVIPSEKFLKNDYNEEGLSYLFNKLTLSGALLRKNLLLLLREDIINEYYSSIRDSLLLTLENETGPTAAHNLIAWYVNTAMPAFSFTSPIHNHPDITETFCHIDYEFCDLMSKLPAGWLYKRSFYGYMIFRCLPNLRSVLYANTGQPLSGKFINYDLSQKGNINRQKKTYFKNSLIRSKAMNKIKDKIREIKINSFLKPNACIHAKRMRHFITIY